MTRLKHRYPQIYDIYDYRHILHRASNFASRALPDKIEQLVKNIYNYFSKSAQRSKRWLDFQTLMDLKPYKVKRYVDTRWLSYKESISRIILRYDKLIELLETHAKETSWMVRNLKKNDM